MVAKIKIKKIANDLLGDGHFEVWPNFICIHLFGIITN